MQFGLALAVLALVLGGSTSARPPKEEEAHSHVDKCAKACAHCALECESCARHCTLKLAAGEKNHAKSLQLCLDCADLCVTAGKVVARKGPTAKMVCKACAEVCDTCAAECEKGDEHMKACGKVCRDCAKECRAMIGGKTATE